MKNVMVVDDNPMHVRMAAKIVSKADPEASIRTYHDPFMALSDALDSPPDLLILDFMMPKMDGLQLLRELRKKGIMTTAIIISAFIKKVSSAMLPGNHVAAVVAKPYSAKDFIQTVKAALEKNTCVE